MDIAMSTLKRSIMVLNLKNMTSAITAKRLAASLHGSRKTLKGKKILTDDIRRGEVSPVLVRGGWGWGGVGGEGHSADAIVASVNPKSVNSSVLHVCLSFFPQAVRSADTLLARSHRVSLTTVRTRIFAEGAVAAGA